MPERLPSLDALRLRVDQLVAWLMGSADLPERLPQRVRVAIERQQDESEILIGWVQVAAILTFATLYSLSPKTFPPDAPFEPVPITLALYSVFVTVRLRLAYSRRLRPWVLVVSVIVDMAVLILTIWSFHIQYQEPPAFYLKAPTLLYIFIIIALRALRFETRYLLLSGTAAAIGWLGLVAYAAIGDPSGAPVTRDYVEYMTSYKILLGGEFDKVISIVAVTIILALSVARARNLVVRAASEGAAVEDMSRFFAPEIAERIRLTEERIRPGMGEARAVAVMFVDLRDFTSHSRGMSPDDVMSLLGDYQSLVVPIIRRNGGFVDKFLGDGIMAVFGLREGGDPYAANALRAAIELVTAMSSWQEARRSASAVAPEFGVAISTGPVIFGAVGAEGRLEFTVIGDAVNLAAKLEKQTKREAVRVLTTLESLRRAADQGFVGSRHEILRDRRIDGIEDPLDLVVLHV